MEDEAFLRGLEDASLSNRAFRHSDHLKAAYLYLRRFGYPHGLDAVEAAIRHFAAANGTPQKFHLTLTLAWGRFVAAHCDGICAAPFEAFLEQNRELLDPTLPLRFYSSARLFDDAARRGWREPDIRALPSVAPWSPARPVRS
jgi:hypothetical protein